MSCLFQLTTSRGGRHIPWLLGYSRGAISTHDLTRRSTSNQQELTLGREHFNSRPHEEVDSIHGRREFFSSNFNSRPHEEVDHSVPSFIHQPDISTHDLTRRSTTDVSTDCFILGISTHDLTRRSTEEINQLLEEMDISTHDLTRRSTRHRTSPNRLCTFQLTTSRGGRPQDLGVPVNLLNISTHDLTRRSTLRGLRPRSTT